MTIFFKTATYAFTSTTRFAIIGLRIAEDTDVDAEFIDVPNEDINYLVHKCLAKAYLTKKGFLNDEITGPFFADKVVRSLRNAETKLGGNTDLLVELPSLDDVAKPDFFRKNFQSNGQKDIDIRYY